MGAFLEAAPSRRQLDRTPLRLLVCRAIEKTTVHSCIALFLPQGSLAMRRRCFHYYHNVSHSIWIRQVKRMVLLLLVCVY